MLSEGAGETPCLPPKPLPASFISGMQTSINIQPVKGGSEQHNKREKPLDYVRSELSHRNAYWESDTQSSRLALIRELYHANTGQRMQSKATPIREGVVVVHDGTTMADLHRLAKAYEDRFGIKTFQIALHKDEGHMNAKEWKANLHAHLVFDWTDDKGKTIKLNRSDMVAMQTLTAEVLGMERGVSSDKTHLSSLQFKVEREQKKLEEIEEAINTAVEASVKPIEAVFDAHRGIFGVKVDEVIKELSKREGEKTKAETIATQKAQREIEALKGQLKREQEARSEGEKKHASVKQELHEFMSLLGDILGERFKAFCEDCERYKRNLFRDLHKFQMWLGDKLTDMKGNEYSADREAGKLLINGKPQEQLLERSRGIRR